MGDVINLRRARKARARDAAASAAQANRARHGRTIAERTRDGMEADRLDRHMAGSRLRDPDAQE
jgi:hypothetical protein